jgi:hypothetical protein
LVTDIFRPFLEGEDSTIPLKTFPTATATAPAVYSASLKQLKRLLLIYRLKFKLASLSVLWQTAVIYIVNGMMHETHTASSSEWRFYFQLCVAGLSDLTRSFRVFEAIAQALLGMALQKNVISVDEAKSIARDLKDLSRHHVPIDGVEDQDQARWIIDLDLGVTDPTAAQGGNLAEQFQSLLLMEEFTTGEYGHDANRDWTLE